MNLTASQYFMAFLTRWGGGKGVDTNKCDFWILHNEASPFGRSVWLSEPIFSKGSMHDVTISCVVKRSILLTVYVIIHYSVTDSKKFIASYDFIVSDFILQLTFKKLPFVKLVLISKKNTHNYLKRLLKYSSFFQLRICARPDFLSYTSTKTTYHDRLNAESGMRIQLSSTEPSIKEIYKNVQQYHSSH